MISRWKSQLGKVSWITPPSASVVIFDKATAKIIEENVVDGLNFFTLSARSEVFYLSASVAIRALFHFMRSLVMQSRTTLSNVRASLLIAYYKACLDCTGARVVVTYVDNSGLFSRLSREYDRATFLAIQNGNRWLDDIMVRDCSLPHFFCFGLAEKDFYEKNEFPIDHYYPVGSLRADIAKNKFSKGPPLGPFDICLVSSWKEEVMNGTHLPELGRALEVLVSYLARYVTESGRPDLKVGIACCGPTSKEQEYYRSLFGSRATIIPNNRTEYTTYRVMSASRVIVNLISTAAVEAFGRGQRVLFCNYTGEAHYDFPVGGLWSLCEVGYEKFSNRLDQLLEIPDAEYLSMAGDTSSYFMKFPADSPNYMVIRSVIEKILKIQPQRAIKGSLLAC
jgi:surface carbohydrate biosynthesis protein